MPRLLLSAALLLALSACDTGVEGPQGPTVIEQSALGKALVAKSTAFGTRLFAEVAAGEDGNIALSPLSASIALTMLLNGADGATADQIQAVLDLAPDQDLVDVNEAYRSLREQLLAADPEVALALANAAFYDQAYPVKAPYLDALRTAFDARVEGLDFSSPTSPGLINQWASDQTGGRIEEVVGEIDPATVLFLLNALYVDGAWATPFDAEATHEGEFRRADGRAFQVSMMSGKVPGRLAEGDGYKAVELPFGRGNFAFVAITPEGETPLADLAARLAAGLWDDATARFDAQRQPDAVEMLLPRFTFESEADLVGPLQALGLTDAFRPYGADLSGINDDPRLYVSALRQDTFFSLDEEGAEGAAVTTVEVGLVSLGPHFFATRPFVFAIRERTTGAILFLGQVADPTR